MSKHKKGEVLRPCYICRESVKFILWEEETKARRKRIFHWVNEDGSHHIHGLNPEKQHLQSIIQEELEL